MDRNDLSLDQLYSLAPQELPILRIERYRGDLMSVNLDHFSTADRNTVLQVYQWLGTLYQAFQESSLHDPDQHKRFRHWNYGELAELVEPLGKGQTVSDEKLRKVIHDIRGGALTTLLMKGSLFELQNPSAGDIQSIYFYVRDHRKMMRNCVDGLDPVAEQHDSSAKPHSIGLLKEKWMGQTHRMAATLKAEIVFYSTFNGSIAERCLEFSALDRIIYNLINNATRFAADRKVHFMVIPVPAHEPKHLRFCFSNAITLVHSASLRAKFGSTPEKLFLGGYSSDSTGQGMNICAEFVRNAYGLRNVRETIKNGYLGVKLTDDLWTAWFHWPILQEG